MPAERLRKTCYVIMGFGKKTDFATGRTLDLDKTYSLLIKPAVEDAGLECTRADEIVHSGLIEKPMYERLLGADVVIADLSTANANVIYELGIRHAMRPFSTIVIAEESLYAVPFDVTASKIQRYKHQGDDIGYSEVVRFRKQLTTAVLAAISDDASSTPDSPVYRFLPGLTPPTMPSEPATNAVKGPLLERSIAANSDIDDSRLRDGVEALKKGDFTTAKLILTFVHGTMKTDDPYVIQQLALATYKSKRPTPVLALEEARELLKTLNPSTSNDSETLGLWGAVHKRLWDLTNESAHLSESVRAYERGFSLRNDYYNGINLAYLLNIRASVATSRADAIADFVLAERVRREVLSICEAALGGENLSDDERYWILATMAEAYVGIGDEAAAEQKLEELLPTAPSPWMGESTLDQLQKLRDLIADSPLKSL